MAFPAELIEQLARGLVVPFVGSGVSSAVEANGVKLFPSWSQLLLGLADELVKQGKPGEADDVRECCKKFDWYKAADAALKGLHKHGFNEYLRKCFGISQKPPGATLSLAEAIWELQPPIVLTTNYDHVLAWSNPRSQPILNNQTGELARLRKWVDRQQPYVWHLHGHISAVDSLILAQTQYEDLYREDGAASSRYRAARFQLQSLLVDRTMLFVGFGMHDAHVMGIIGEVLRIFEGHTPPHFALLQQGESDVGKLWGDHNVHTITYENYGQLLLDLLGELAVHVTPPAVTSQVQPLPSESPAREQYPPFAKSKLPPVNPDFVGRKVDREMLDAAWEGPKKKNIVTIVAWGGTGKTSLVVAWAQAKLSSGEVERYFDWSFYKQGTQSDDQPTGTVNVGSANPSDDRPTGAGNLGSADLFVEEALHFFGDPDLANSKTTAAAIKGKRLAELVGKSHSLVILDGLEPLQDAEGAVRSDALLAFLRGLEAENSGLCVITTRRRLSNIGQDRDSKVREWDLPGLSVEEGADLLRRLRVKGSREELEQLAEDVKGHALTLTLLGKFLVHAHHGDIRQRDLISIREADYEEERGHAFRVIEAYEKWLEENDQDALAILRLMGLFDRPATPGCIHALRTGEPIAGVTDQLVGLSEAGWNQAVSRLAGYGLIEEVSWENVCINGFDKPKSQLVLENVRKGQAYDPGNPSPLPDPPWYASKSLDSHPLVREYFTERMPKREGVDWREAHSRLFDHLIDSVPYWPEELIGLAPLYQSIAHGANAGRFNDAFNVYWQRIQREVLAYSHRTLGAFDEELVALGTFFKERYTHPISSFSESQQAHVLGLTGSRLRAVGRFREAIPVLTLSIEQYKRLSPPEPKFEALRARHLSETFFAIGEFSHGVQYARDAVDTADAQGDWYLSSAARCVLGSLFHHRGELKEAHAAFEEAQRELKRNPLGLTTLYSLWGFRYLELLLDEGKYEEVLASAGEMAKAWDAGLPDRAPEQGLKPLGPMLESLAVARFELEQAIVAGAYPSLELTERFKKLSDDLWDMNRHDFRPYGRLAFARVLRLAGRYQEAEGPVSEVWEMATRDQMKVFQADCWLECAQLYIDAKPGTTFDSFVEKVLGSRAKATVEEDKLIDFIRKGYQRRKQLLEKIEKQLKSIGSRGQGRQAVNLLYYVSGHGYGHAIRSAEVIAAFYRRRPDARVFVRTTAPAFLFSRDDGPTPEVSPASLDSGAIENGIFEVNAEATIARLGAVIQNREALLKQERDWVKAHDVEVIVADIPWLAGDIAQACGIPCIGISNFLWSWIYQPFLMGHNDAGAYESELVASYEKFTVILRLPLAHAMDQFHCVRDVPLVVSRSRRDPGELLQAIGCRPNDSRTRVVVSLRDTDSIEAISRIAPRQPDVLFLLPGAHAADVLANLKTVETGSAINLSDLAAIADVMLAKPGYGILSACAANRVRLMCLPRNGFREDEVLLREGRQLIPIEMLPHEEFRQGTWGNRLRTLLDFPIPSVPIDLNGADVCAQIISTY